MLVLPTTHFAVTGEDGTYKIEGVGEDFIPGATDFSLIDRVISCSDVDGLNLTRRLAREEAVFVGGSGGMAAWVALQVAKTGLGKVRGAVHAAFG